MTLRPFLADVHTLIANPTVLSVRALSFSQPPVSGDKMEVYFYAFGGEKMSQSEEERQRREKCAMKKWSLVVYMGALTLN